MSNTHNIKLALLTTAMLVQGCGGGSEGSSSATSAPQPAQPVAPTTQPIAQPTTQTNTDTFAELEVPNDFNWQDHDKKQVQFHLVSNVSQINARQQTIAGRHITNVYALNSDTNRRGDLIFSGMTNMQGVLPSLFNLPVDTVNIEVEVNFQRGSCQNTFTTEQLLGTQAISCDVVLASDL